MPMNRREMLQQASLGAAALALAPLQALAADNNTFTLPKLPYAFDALEPHIDKETMEIHHDRHHKTYVDNLNKALASHADLRKQPIEAILRKVKEVPKEVPHPTTNNVRGHYNHTPFWEVMSPRGGGEPSGALAKAIAKDFGSFAKFQDALATKALTRFGSGWAWLLVERDGEKSKLLV